MIIGICGPKHSGKTFASDYLVTREGFGRVRFSDPLKRMTSALLHDMGIPALHVRKCVEGDLKEKPLGLEGLETLTSRFVQQTLGTEWARDTVDPDLWVKIAKLKASAMIVEGKNVVIDDVRFTNEAQMIRAAGGRIIEVRRPGYDYSETHRSEMGLRHDLIDATVMNDCEYASEFHGRIKKELTA